MIICRIEANCNGIRTLESVQILHWNAPPFIHFRKLGRTGSGVFNYLYSWIYPGLLGTGAGLFINSAFERNWRTLHVDKDCFFQSLLVCQLWVGENNYGLIWHGPDRSDFLFRISPGLLGLAYSLRVRWKVIHGFYTRVKEWFRYLHHFDYWGINLHGGDTIFTIIWISQGQ